MFLTHYILFTQMLIQVSFYNIWRIQREIGYYLEKPMDDRLWRRETLTVGSQANMLPHFVFQEEGVNLGIQRLSSNE